MPARVPCDAVLKVCLRNPPACSQHRQHLSHLPSRERETRRGRGKAWVWNIFPSNGLDMEKESFVLQKKREALFNVYMFRSHLCRNGSSASLENLPLLSLAKMQDKLPGQERSWGTLNRDMREKSKHSSYRTRFVFLRTCRKRRAGSVAESKQRQARGKQKVAGHLALLWRALPPVRLVGKRAALSFHDSLMMQEDCLACERSVWAVLRWKVAKSGVRVWVIGERVEWQLTQHMSLRPGQSPQR